jgi:hypothetical protein
MVGTAVWAVFLGVVCPSVLGREVKLTIYPQKVSAEAGQYSLLPSAASLTDGDAAPLYAKAVKTLPAEKDRNQGSRWLALPVEQFPLPEVQSVLERSMEGLRGAARAVRCRECNWPKLTGGPALSANAEELRRLRVIVQLWARYEIVQGNPQGAILALQTGFGMAQHVAAAPSTLQFMTGVANVGSMCREVEQFVQIEDAPNLYAALTALPRPFVDVEKAIERDEAVPSELPPELKKMTREQLQSELKAAHDRLRFLVKRLDRDLALLQCIEAIRSYAASHGGQLPQALADIKEVPIPNDPLTGTAFRYAQTGTTAVLESPAPAGGNEKDALRYEIVGKN